MLLRFGLVKQDTLLSLTKLLNWCLGRSLPYISEDSLDPDLCSSQTNGVNIFLVVYIPDLNISKHVKLTFLHRSLQGLCRLRLPKNPAELASPGRGSIPRRQAKAKLRAAVSRCLPATAQRELPRRQVFCLPICTDREGGTLCSCRSAPSLEHLPLPFDLFPDRRQAPALHNLCFLPLAFPVDGGLLVSSLWASRRLVTSVQEGGFLRRTERSTVRLSSSVPFSVLLCFQS